MREKRRQFINNLLGYHRIESKNLTPNPYREVEDDNFGLIMNISVNKGNIV